MQARLDDGQIVTLEKECGCRTHEGPHWIHMDEHDKRISQEHQARMHDALKSNNDQDFKLAMLAHGRNESQRLKTKAEEMKARRIVELIR